MKGFDGSPEPGCATNGTLARELPCGQRPVRGAGRRGAPFRAVNRATWSAVGARLFGRSAAGLAALLAAWLLVLSAMLVPPAQALDIEFTGRVVKRDVLALYDSRYEKEPSDTRIHKFAEMPLNYLGYRVVYRDVNGPMPAASELDRYRGLLTWFVEPLRRPEAIVKWMDQAVGKGLKYVVLGEVAPPDPAALLDPVNRLLARIGLNHSGGYVDLTYKSKVTVKDREIMEFERPVDKALPGFPMLTAIGADTHVHLGIETPAGSGQVAAVVATGPGGGFASQDFTIFYEAATDRVRWTLNPFAFFKRAFGDDRFPIPDPTTLSGRRMYFSHIDGDGWNNVSDIEGHREFQRLSAEVVAREAIIPYPDLPVSVALIAGDIDAELGGNPLGRRIARQLYALRQVELASHTYTHPYTWQFFEGYDRSDELVKVDQYQPPDLSLRERLTRGVMHLAKKEISGYGNDKYVAGTDDLPRTYLKKSFDLNQEISGSLRVVESLSPQGRKARLLQWSGDTMPYAAAIRATRQAGVRNINGGDSRLDQEFPSVAYVPPISRTVGRERQIYSGNSNENTYTNDWTGPYYGFFMLDHTLDNTERPRRLKPFNLYYHMYSGERAASLASIVHFLNRARKSDVIPVPASQYAAAADDFFAAEIEQLDHFTWAVTKRGALQTVRFDNADALVVDLAHSFGVLGSTRHERSLYVSLDSAAERAVVTLIARSLASPVPSVSEPALALRDSRWMVSDLKPESCGLAVTAQGFGSGDMTWTTAPDRMFQVTVERGAVPLLQQLVKADAEGLLTLQLAANAVQPLTIRFACHE